MAPKDELTAAMAKLADEIAGNGIDADEVMRLRREVFADGVVNHDEARLLFHLNETVPHGSEEAWYDFFVEALSDFFVWKQEPPGYLAEDDARFLIAQVNHDGRIDDATEFGLVVNMLQKLRLSPPGVVDLALKGVVETVLGGGVNLFGPGRRRPNVIDPVDVDVIRAVVFAAGGDGSLTVTKREADLLFELNNETVEAENAPEWQTLFVQAVGHYLMYPDGAPAVPDRAEAARREAWLESRRGTGGLLAEMTQSVRQLVLGALTGALGGGGGDRTALGEAEAFAREAIDAPEAAWLLSQLKRDGILHENEKALLAYIKKMSPNIHASLEGVMQEAGV